MRVKTTLIVKIHFYKSEFSLNKLIFREISLNHKKNDFFFGKKITKSQDHLKKDWFFRKITKSQKKMIFNWQSGIKLKLPQSKIITPSESKTRSEANHN